MEPAIELWAAEVGFHVDVPNVPDGAQRAFATYHWAYDYAIAKCRETGFPVRDQVFDREIHKADITATSAWQGRL